MERELDIPVFHDDQHGTAIVVTAALINALRVVGKKMEDVHIVLNGPGAAGTAIIKMLMTAGAKDIIAVDQFGTLYKGCNSAEAHKNWLGEMTNPRQIKGGLKEALEGADVFIGVSRPGILTTELCKTMNKDAIVFAMANPTPEIMPDEAKAGGVRVMATGRSDFPNQVNNVLCFPGLFKGALSVRARDINNEMKLAAAYAIADLITDADRSEEFRNDCVVAQNAAAKAARDRRPVASGGHSMNLSLRTEHYGYAAARPVLANTQPSAQAAPERRGEPWPLAKNTQTRCGRTPCAAKEKDQTIRQIAGMACVLWSWARMRSLTASFPYQWRAPGTTSAQQIAVDLLRRATPGDNHLGGHAAHSRTARAAAR